jgi:hypothetical protein
VTHLTDDRICNFSLSHFSLENKAFLHVHAAALSLAQAAAQLDNRATGTKQPASSPAASFNAPRTVAATV